MFMKKLTNFKLHIPHSKFQWWQLAVGTLVLGLVIYVLAGVAKAQTSLTCPAVASYSPADNTNGAALTTTLSWGEASGATGLNYQAFVDDDTTIYSLESTEAGQPRKISGISTALSFAPPGLVSGTLYNWGVKVTASGATTIYCPSRRYMHFRTAYAEPTGPATRKEYPVEIFRYDGRVVLNPPPGFNDFRGALPRVSEVPAN